MLSTFYLQQRLAYFWSHSVYCSWQSSYWLWECGAYDFMSCSFESEKWAVIWCKIML